MNQTMDTKGIDGLRGIAALCIAIFTHYFLFVPERTYPFYNRLTYWFWNYASYFVDLFFVISGFIMVFVYRNKIKNAQIGFVDFVKKRLLRFYPLMVFALLCVLILQLIHLKMTGVFFAYKDIYDNSVLSFIFNLLCLQGTTLVASSFNAPSWYLSIVLVMYILFYAATYTAGRHDMENIAYMALMLLGIVIAVKNYETVFLNCRGLIGFFAGCLTCTFCEWANRQENRKRQTISGIVFLVFAGTAVTGIMFGHKVFAPDPQVVLIYEMLLWPCLVFLAVHVKLLRAFLKNPVFLFLGKISFSMYLIHFPVMVLLENLNQCFSWNLNYESRKVCLLYVALMMVLSVLCYFFVEQKLMKRLAGAGHA